jgi:hypothetical protein
LCFAWAELDTPRTRAGSPEKEKRRAFARRFFVLAKETWAFLAARESRE